MPGCIGRRLCSTLSRANGEVSGTCYTRDVPTVTGSGAAAAALEIRSVVLDAKQRE